MSGDYTSLIKSIFATISARQKRIKVAQSLKQIIQPRLSALGFRSNQNIMFKQVGGNYEYSRVSADERVDLVVFYFRRGVSPYVQTHLQLLNQFIIEFNVYEPRTKSMWRLEQSDKLFCPPAGEFPWNSAWVFDDPISLRRILNIVADEFEKRGATWFELIRQGIRGEGLMHSLGVPVPPMKQDEYDKSPWRQRFSPN